MTDLQQKELEDFRAYRATFLAGVHGQRVLSDLMDVFKYNTIEKPFSSMDMAKLDGARDVIRYILDKCGFTANTEAFVRVLSSVIVNAPEPFDQGEAEIAQATRLVENRLADADLSEVV